MRNLGAAVAIVLAALLVFGANAGCRNYRINQCEERGGEAVVPPWLSGDPIGVACIEGRNHA